MKNTSTFMNPFFERATALLARRFGAALLALLASACSASPSESEIKQALQAQLGNVGGPGAVGDLLRMEVKSVNKLGCEKSGEAFVCDIETEISTRGGSAGKKAMRIRMVKSKDVWKAIFN